LQARDRLLQRAVERFPAAIVGLLSSSEDFRPRNAVGFAAQTDCIGAPKACKAPTTDCICRQKVFICRPKAFIRQKQSVWAAKPLSFCIRKPSEPLRKLSKRACSRARGLLRLAVSRLQRPVQRAQCCPAKHPDGYIEALF